MKSPPLFTRRSLLAGIAGSVGASLLYPLRAKAAASPGRALKAQLTGFTLGIHVPATAGLVDILPTLPGNTAPRVSRVDSLRIMTQALVSQTVDIGAGDFITTLRAVEAGADLKIVGQVFNSSSLVFVVNADRVKRIEDLQQRGTTVAINSKGDATHVLLVGPLLQRGLDLSKTTLVEIGGSGARMRALLSGRVHAVPVHFDQALELARQGNYRILVEPWKEYPAWFGEAWVVHSGWLQKPENSRAVTDVLKSTLRAFRHATNDFAWFAEKSRRHSTVRDAAKADDATLRPVWEKLAQEIKAWPPAMDSFSAEGMRALLPVYKAANAIRGTVDLSQVIDRRPLEQALRELA
jgi:NitT/TauT family transport system substrate-binding protein